MQPYLCPVCKGTGKVVSGFYDKIQNTSCALEYCRACEGKGILWGWDSSPTPDSTPWISPGDGNITFSPDKITWSSADMGPNQDDETIAMNNDENNQLPTVKLNGDNNKFILKIDDIKSLPQLKPNFSWLRPEHMEEIGGEA